MGIQHLETLEDFHEKVLHAKNDKTLVLHPFVQGMSSNHFAPQIESISNASSDLCCFGLDLGKVESAYKELGIQGLPIVMFFKNGEKIGEIVGCVDPKSVQVVLARSMPDLKIPETTATTITARPIKKTRNEDEDPGNCKVCQLERIVKLLQSHPSDGMVHTRHEIGVHELAANTEHCYHCRFLVQTCQKDLSLYEHVKSIGGEVTILTKRDKGLARLDLDGTRKHGIWNTDRFKSRILQKIELSEAQDDSIHFSGRFVQSEVDFGLCRQWLVNCRKYHSKTCHREATNLTELGLRLIDINTRCIVDAPADAKYAALSYAWGDAKQLKLINDTFQRLTHVGGLSDEHSDIPKTICDAMTVATRLKLNYLWVDALCIKQDDDVDKLRQIAQMDKVYSCAALTIVSTGPDADTEIPGLRKSSRTPNQVVCKIGDVQLINTLPTLSQALSISRWDHRGWTLQEKALSHRLLIFTEFQVYWHCNSAIYAEDTDLELSKDRRSLNQIVEHYEEYSAELRRIYKPSPTDSAEYQYTSLLRSYMTRDLTYQGDAMNAFTGVLNILRSELGSPHWGLPALKFDGAMLWQLDGHFPERRREEFPSWSWAGWRGGVDVEMNEGGLDTASKIVWWKIDDTGALVKVNPDRTIETQSGYTNEFFGVDSLLPPPSPDDIPVDFDYSVENPKHPPRSHLLRFWTSLARLTIGRTPVRSRGETYSEYPVYAPGQDRSVSTVVLDDSWRKERKDEFDVIFLSRTGEAYKFKYDIKVWTMIILWNNNVAYRVQQFVFPIRLVHWEAAKPQFKLVTLA